MLAVPKFLLEQEERREVGQERSMKMRVTPGMGVMLLVVEISRALSSAFSYLFIKL